ATWPPERPWARCWRRGPSSSAAEAKAPSLLRHGKVTRLRYPRHSLLDPPRRRDHGGGCRELRDRRLIGDGRASGGRMASREGAQLRHRALRLRRDSERPRQGRGREGCEGSGGGEGGQERQE